MEKNIKFRNHISVIFENAARTIGILFFIFVGNFVSSMDEMDDMGEHTLLLVVILIGIFAILVGWQVLVWAKTHISIQENTLVVERDTLNKKRNTIGLKNISNVNLEQNLFEMMIGTCKVKMDTNSLSTADQTDVKIVLKKADAEAFRRWILEYIGTEEAVSENVVVQKQFISGMDDIVMHGVFSLNIVSVLVFAGAIFGTIGVFSDLLVEDTKGGLIGIILSILVTAWILGGFAWNVVKGFVKYIDFKIARRGDKIYLNYGLFKKVAYSIPVDKINGVRFTQTMIARLFKRYMVEVINVGLDDDEAEEQSFFLPYAKHEKIQAQMSALLPEFEGYLEIKEEKQPKSIWIIWIPVAVFFLTISGIAYGVCAELFPEAKIAVLAGSGAMCLLLIIKKVAVYRTVGVAVDNKLLKIVDGAFGKRILFVKYGKIQYVKTRQNVIAKKYGLQKGEIHLLAALKNQIHHLPYFREEKLEELRGYLNK